MRKKPCLIYEEGSASPKTKKTPKERKRLYPIVLMTMKQFFQLLNATVDSKEE